MKKLAVVAFGLIIGVPGVTPAQAFPAINPPRIEGGQQIEQVQWHHGGDGHWDGDHYGDYHHHHHHGSNWGLALGGLALGAIIGGALSQPYYGSYYGSYYGAPYRYYGRPYGYYRPYRHPYYAGISAHERWCYARYGSYRAFDNTFQPYYGPRRQCLGPY
ncbi:BA14K family protein [Rhizobium mesoamericanum]|uniref:Lectin-like protein BA14k n=1 Tax=Rhizobium mesoamericanum STM3625 TaxID=1211777 RepID=K0Q0X5_9HYPH|nr:BA14K family protein [Rhizobium mesoamericanum]CCM76024.1 conserved exported hypothetical protein [Rhizobium mesoamericanum STM3625]